VTGSSRLRPRSLRRPAGRAAAGAGRAAAGAGRAELQPEGQRAFSVADLRAAESQLLAAVPPGALMQRAAAALAAVTAGVLREHCGGVTGRRVVLLVGAGNNGGDALWAGARLAGRGARVQAVLTAGSVHEPGLAALLAAGGTMLDAGADGGVAEAGTAVMRADVLLDGLVGLGGRAGLRAPAEHLVADLPADLPVVAVDLPSGVDPDTGETPGPHVRAGVTVSFGADKPCLLLPPADLAAGRVVRVDLGMAPHLPVLPAVERLDLRAAAARWPVPGPVVDKYRRGVAGLVVGSTGYPGAAVLCARGALGAGVGMLRYLGPPEVTNAVRSACPEVVAGPGRVQAWVLGSGVDPRDQTRAADLDRAIRSALDDGVPCVIDAGALSLLPDRVPPGWLLTPHAGELATLLSARGRPVGREQVEASPARYARAAVEVTGGTVLVKGATTLVADPDGRLRSQADGPGWLATAGSGDVLAGIAGALLAAGLPAIDAGTLATLVHGRAGHLASAGGPVSAVAVAAALPAAVARLLRHGSSPGPVRDPARLLGH
jgi:ADP-dependent NAD(P)H-hydrate dehydratase / NAD(P)H-hydrate epimerase